MVKKPSLADLAQKKPSEAIAPAENRDETVRAGAAKRPGIGADGRKGILVRVQPAGWRQLRDLAAELTEKSGEQTTMQDLLTGAINRLLKEHGRPPVA